MDSTVGWIELMLVALTFLGAWAVAQSVLQFYGVVGNGVRKMLDGKMVGLPPGRMGWPLAGETIEFIKATRAKSLRDNFILPRRKMAGSNVFKTHALGVPMVVVSGPEANKLVLWGEYKMVDTMLLKSMKDVLGSASVVNAVNDLHRHLRRLLADPMSPLAIKNVVARVEAATIKTLNDWEAAKEFSAYQASRKFTYSIILDVLLSARKKDQLDLYFENIERLAPGAHNVPLLIPGTAYYKGMKARKEMHIKIEREIERRNTQPEWERPDDVLSHLMRNVDEVGGKLSMVELKDTIVTMMFAGYDTTSTTLACCIQYIHDHPDVYQKLQEETDALRAELGPDGPLTWDIIKGPKMRYTQMVIQETHRHLSLAYAILRSVKKDMEYEGYLIPKGWYVLLDVTSTHYNPAYFENPSVFNPSRFETKPAPFSFMPFGMGPRMCVGQELASVELLLFVHHLVSKYRWEVTAKNIGLDFGPSVGRPRNKVPIKIERRV